MEQPSTSSPLGTYLNDHLAGATGGVEMLRRAAKAHRHDGLGRDLAELAEDVAQDRRALLGIMASLGIPVRRLGVAMGWLAEKAGRLKLNGRLLSRSPLSDVMELELMRLGVEGKALGWRTLRSLSDTDRRLDASTLDDLLRRATEQADALEAMRTRTATRVLVADRS
ncbi:hypothetical protein ACWGCW_14610 [Streptomyces sp. NPDC054933]